ncbi:hypothetical protein [Pseudoalteromonas piscicida]|uniref:hypothetical protein n=1 Tax=Pseudoalteromonas piscicida TaxID=43662 RepID=UPI00309D92A2
MSDCVMEAHAELSALSEDYARELVSIGRSDFNGFSLDSIPDYLGRALEMNQAVPLIVGEEFLDNFETLSLQIGSLLLDVPRRYAINDLEFASRFYGFNQTDKAYDALVQYGSYDTDMYRLDLINGAGGFKVLEVNMGGAASGFYGSTWLDLYASIPFTEAFLDKHNKDLDTKNTIEMFFRHTLKQSASLKEVQASKQINFFIKAPDDSRSSINEYLTYYLNLLGQEFGLNAHLVLREIGAEVTLKDGFAYIGDERIDVYIKADGDICVALYEAYKLGNVHIYDGISGFFSGNKRNMALVTSQRVDEYYTDEERAILDKYVPWTAMMSQTELVYQGQVVNPAELAIRDKDSFVLKGADCHSGVNVFVGRFMTQSEWQKEVESHIGAEDWLLQAYCESKPYIMLDSQLGFVKHEVVWGSFIVADQAAGGTLRMKPMETTDGVVNYSRNATESLFCTLVDRDN